MAQKKDGYTRIHIDNLAGGLADSGSPAVINNNQSPSLYNVDFSRYGSVMARAVGDVQLDDHEAGLYDSVLALARFTVCDSCGFFDEPTALPGTIAVTRDSAAIVGTGTNFLTTLKVDDLVLINGITYTILSVNGDTSLTLTSPFGTDTDASTTIFFVHKSPKPSGIPILIGGFGVRNGSNTVMRYYDFSLEAWVNFDTIDGKHPFDIAAANCRIYYSNGYTDLRYACFRKVSLAESGREPTTPCEVEVSGFGYPTCASEYGSKTQTTVVIDIINKFIVFGDGRPGPDLTDLKAWIATATNEIVVTVPDPNDPNNATTTFTIKGAFRLEGNILYYTSVPAGNAAGGTFYEKVSLAFNFTTLIPTYCGGVGSNRIAEGIRGYILTTFDHRLWLSGDLKEHNLDQVAYSRKAQEFSNETDVAIHLGDFDVVGFKHTISDSDRILFNNSSAEVKAITVQDGNIYVHRVTDSGTEIHQMVLTAVGTYDGYYKPILVNTSNCASWFRNIIVTNGLQYYITTFFGVPEAKAFGLFPTFLTPKAEDRSQDIRGTMEKMDFSRGAVAYFNRKIYYAGRFVGQCDNGFKLPDSCPDSYDNIDPNTGKNDTLLVYDLDANAYSIYKGFSVGTFLTTEGQLFYGSSIDGAVYYLDPDALGDKIAEHADDGEAEEINSFFSLKKFNFNEPGLPKSLYRVYIEGYLAPGASINIGLTTDCSKTLYNSISYKDIIELEKCEGDCSGLESNGCKGKYNSSNFKKHIEFAGGTPIDLMTIQPFIEGIGFWQVDYITFFIKQKADDDLEGLTNCGSINTINDNKCFL